MIDKIKIGPQMFTVEYRDPEKDGMLSDGNYAYVLDSGNIIVMSKGIEQSKLKQLHIHEILHAISMVLGNRTKPPSDATADDWEHHFIETYESGLLMVMQDNPELVKWLSS